jgi:hypothetical protein
VHPLKLVPALVLAAATGACAPNVQNMGPSYDGNPDLGVPIPPMAPDRKVTEQDCSKAIDFYSGTLRCK